MSLFTKTSSNFIAGTTLDDLILVNLGSDANTGSITGGTGVDELRFASTTQNDLLIVDETNIAGIERVVIGTGTAAAALLTGTTALDVDATFAANGLAIIGNAGANMILGTLFADTLIGGLGADELYGGAGNDRFIVNSAAEHPTDEVIDGEAGVDTIFFAATAAGTLLLNADDNVEAVVIGTAAGVTTGTVALNVDASGMFNLFGVRVTGNAGANSLTGTAYDDALLGGAGNDTLTAGTGNDTLDGSLGNDTLSAGDGNDTLVGGAGADSLSGGNGDDLFLVGTTADLVAGDAIAGGAGFDTLRFDAVTAGANIVLGAGITGIEQIMFGAAAQGLAVNLNAQAVAGGLAISGTNGANVIVGTAGVDDLRGGGGNDVFVISNAADHGAGERILGEGGVDEIRFAGTAGTLVLSDQVDVERVVIAGGTLPLATATTANVGVDASAVATGLILVGNAGSNALTGTSAGDQILGGVGNDTLLGGDGNDTLIGGAGADSMDGAGGDDVYRFLAATDSAVGEVVADSGTLEQVLITPGVQQSLYGYGGPEYDAYGHPVWAVDPVYGTDILPGFDTIEYAGASGVLALGAGTAGIENVRLAAGTGTGGINASAVTYALPITGNAGANAITGTIFDDTITGGLGADTLIGGAGNDTFIVNTPAELVGDVITGGAGIDRLVVGGTAQFVPSAAVSVDIIQGRNINASAVATGVTLFGDPNSSSTLVGGAGSDTLQGGPGVDTLIGGAGNDTFLAGTLSTFAGDKIDGGAGIDNLVYSHDGSEDVVLGSLMQLAGVNSGDILLLGMGGQMTGVERIQIGSSSTDTTAASVLADGSVDPVAILQNLFQNTLEITLEQLNAVSAAGLFDVLLQRVLNNTVPPQLQDLVFAVQNGATDEQLVEYINTQLGVGPFGLGLAALLPPSLGALAPYNPNFVTAGLQITGNDGDNMISGTRFADTLTGGAGNDVFVISRASDHGPTEIIQGGTGIDELRFTSEVAGDTLFVAHNVTGIETFRISDLDGNSGFSANVNLDGSLLRAGATLFGNAGNNHLTGTNFADSLVGGAGDDVLEGGRGNDTLDGGTGLDKMLGGLGNDIFVNLDSGGPGGEPLTEMLNGGGGFDTVQITDQGTLDLTTLAAHGFLNIERIDMTSGDDTLVVDFSHVLESVLNGGTLRVDGGTGDSVLLNEAWTPGTPSGGYTQWTHTDGTSTAHLLIGQGISVGQQFTATAAADTLVGGVTDDIFIFTEATLNTGDSVDGGAGNDVVRLTGGGTFDLNKLSMTGIEDVYLTGVAGTVILGTDPVTVHGTSAEDIFSATPATLAQETVDGGDGMDILQFALNGGTVASSPGGTSLEMLSVTGGGTITLESLWQNGVMFDDGSYTATLGTLNAPTVNFGGGDDSLILYGAANVSIIDMGAGQDTVSGSAANGESISLGAGDDLWNYDGGPLNQGYISGGDGNDTLGYSGNGNLTFNVNGPGDGYEGFENLDASAATGNLTVVQNGEGAIATGSGNDTVHNAGANDIIDLGGGNDTVEVSGPLGAQISGGAGSDTIVFSDALGSVVVHLDFATDQFAASGGTFSGFENLDAGVSFTSFTVTASASGSSITTGFGNDTIYLGAGVDIVNTGSGTDTVVGTPSAGDSVTLNDLNAVFDVNGAFADGITFNVLAANGGGTIDVSASSGTVVLDLAKFSGFSTVECATDANVTVVVPASGIPMDVNFTGNGNDTLLFNTQVLGDFNLGGGNDSAEWALTAGGSVSGGAGTDTITYSGDTSAIISLADSFPYSGFENLDAHLATGDVTANANAVGSSMLGGAGDDILSGFVGNDTLVGGLGEDTLTGSLGNDVFVFDQAPAVGNDDTITDFTQTNVDEIWLSLSAFSALGSTGAVAASAVEQAWDVTDGSGTASSFLKFDITSGELYYDANGSDTGGAGLQLIATLTNVGSLYLTGDASGDLFVV
jgi:Ca2+-binding RTX toxin-like protein